MNSFVCKNCGHKIPLDKEIGTQHRNHCPFCLYSLHLDNETGDRESKCKYLMKPIGLTFKHEGIDRYGKLRQGEIMVIHRCLGCDKLSINRVAADDSHKAILDLLSKDGKKDLKDVGIKVLSQKDFREVKKQLLGNN